MHDACPCKIFLPDASFGVYAAWLLGWVPGGVYSAFLWIRSCPWVPDGCVIPSHLVIRMIESPLFRASQT
jgi:hypothetical protein